MPKLCASQLHISQSCISTLLPSNPTSGIYPRETKAYILKNTYTEMLIETLYSHQKAAHILGVHQWESRLKKISVFIL